MSDLANSCEYLSVDKLCVLIRDNPKTKTFRQLNCKNNQNITSCCYLCVHRSQCATSCKYLGQSESSCELRYVAESRSTDAKELKDDVSQFESVPAAFCFSCNVEMAYTITQFTIDNWKGATHTMMLVCDKVLPVTVLLCPKCGKIEFKARCTT